MAKPHPTPMPCELPDFELTPEQARTLADLLGISEQDDIDRLAADLNELGARYRLWTDQDDDGPARRDRNTALGRVQVAGQKLADALDALEADGAERDLLDALDRHPYTRADEAPVEYGHFQTEALSARLRHLDCGLDRYLARRKAQRGPDRRKTLPAIVAELASVYTDWTGKPVTHTPFARAHYESAPQSPAGRFMRAFFEIVDPKLPPSTLSSALAGHIKRRTHQSESSRPSGHPNPLI